MTKRLRAYALMFALGLAGCASYRGTARDADAEVIAREAGWRRVQDVPFVPQRGEKDCGAAVLSSVLAYHAPELGEASERGAIDRALRASPGQGLLASDLRDYARRRGLSAFVFKGTFADLEHEIAHNRPVIVGVHKPLSSNEALAHYEVFVGYHPEKELVLTLDPAEGLRENELVGFLEEWQRAGEVALVVLPRRAPSAAVR